MTGEQVIARGARGHHRIVVRQAGSQGTHHRPARMGGRAGRQERPDLRSEVHLHPSTRTGGPDRGRHPGPRRDSAGRGYNGEMTRIALALALAVAVAACGYPERWRHGAVQTRLRRRLGRRQRQRNHARRGREGLSPRRPCRTAARGRGSAHGEIEPAERADRPGAADREGQGAEDRTARIRARRRLHGSEEEHSGRGVRSRS